ncbi:hypothetical protein M2444_000488 [Paenibacillus sp. PastF-3]|jgi:hypothetical protein|nr:hypothetical protein [Paenibacillus sp. PastF-3]
MLFAWNKGPRLERIHTASINKKSVIIRATVMVLTQIIMIAIMTMTGGGLLALFLIPVVLSSRNLNNNKG